MSVAADAAQSACRRVSAPRSASLHPFRGGAGHYLFDVEEGRIFPLSDDRADAIGMALRFNDIARAEMIARGFGLLGRPCSEPDPLTRVSLKALSLAVAQKCNLSCTYCYAQHGTFGGEAGDMPPSVAKDSVDRLLDGIEPGGQVTLAFMGGEPLANRHTLHATTRYAAAQAAARGLGVGFSMTTNATLIRPEDIALFQEYGFMLTVSIDGLQPTNDQSRPFASGKGSFEQVAERVRQLLGVDERCFQVFARVTVTSEHRNLPEILEGLLELGFDSILFSPLLSAPTDAGEMQAEDLDRLLEQLIHCAERFRAALPQGRILPISNLTKTLQRIHSRERNQYPCGAGGGYMGVSADGDLYACHRFVNDYGARMGDVKSGIDAAAQTAWLADRELARQTPCTSCWARYLCSGSCHYEAINRGRPACDYIRGWLHYCLTLYADLAAGQPEMLEKILESA